MLESLKISRELRQKIEAEVPPGEFIRWIGQPIPRFFTPSSITAFIFSIPWTAFAVFWMYGAMGFQLPNLQKGIQVYHVFALFGVPFVLIGLGMMLSPLWVWLEAKKTVYLITEKRAILFLWGEKITIKSYTPKEMSKIFRREGKNGTGDVIFSVIQTEDSDGDKVSKEVGFINIANVQEVERLLKNLSSHSLDGIFDKN